MEPGSTITRITEHRSFYKHDNKRKGKYEKAKPRSQAAKSAT
jgi:hypothetical protein